MNMDKQPYVYLYVNGGILYSFFDIVHELNYVSIYYLNT